MANELSHLDQDFAVRFVYYYAWRQHLTALSRISEKYTCLVVMADKKVTLVAKGTAVSSVLVEQSTCPYGDDGRGTFPSSLFNNPLRANRQGRRRGATQGQTLNLVLPLFHVPVRLRTKSC